MVKGLRKYDRRWNIKKQTAQPSHILLLFSIATLIVVLLMRLAPSTVHSASGVRSDSGPTAASIQATVEQFRYDVGGGNTLGDNGSFGGKRREVDLKSVADIFSGHAVPPNSLNLHLSGGIVLATRGSGFQVSQRHAASNPGANESLDGYEGFSERLLSPVGSNLTDISFKIPGTTMPATISSFGVVFKNLAGDDHASMQFFDANGIDRGTFQIPVTESEQGYSILGITFTDGERITRVRIMNGKAVPESTHQSGRMVSFIYSEPQPLSPNSLFVVTNTNDSGVGSLRQAILDSNMTIGFDTINFNIAGPGVKVISPISPLPIVTDPVLIDGYSQPGSSANTLPNGENAVLQIQLNGAQAGAGVNGLDIFAGNTTIRGLAINGFGANGIILETNGANIVSGNFIGTDATGLIDLGNGDDGILLYNSSNNSIGGNSPATRNLISGNDDDGVDLGDLSTASNNQIQGNFIGTDLSGSAALANTGNGIRIANGNGNSIGAGLTESSNVIAFNGADGILAVAGNNNSFQVNSIFSNTLLGIDLLGDGVTQNDFNDNDAGPNDLQNYPFLQSSSGAPVTTNGILTNISGSINSNSNRSYLIDFYTSPTCDSSNNGEGVRFFRQITITTNSGGSASFSASFPAPVTAGHFLTATATPLGGGTSEFSPCTQIVNLTSTVQFSSSNYSVTEGTQNGFAQITVNRTSNTSSTASIAFSTSNGTAIAGEDYTATSGILTFGQFESSRSFIIPITDDSVSEPNETINLTLSSSSNAVLGQPSTAVLTISDNESLIQFSAPTYTGSEAPNFVSININRSVSSSAGVSVNYATSDGTATAGQDYIASSGTITFGSFETSRFVSIQLLDDSIVEPTETFNITLSSPSGGAFLNPPSTAVVNITDNELRPFSVDDVSIVEGNSGVTNAAFTVSLPPGSANQVRVNYETADGTAKEGSDYVANFGTLIFNPGETTKTVLVAIIGDSALEPNEVFALNLSPLLNASVSDGQGIGTIEDDDQIPTPTPSPATVQFSAANYIVTESYGSAEITVTRQGSNAGTTVVDYLASDNTATQRTDLVFGSGRLTFAPGEASKTLQVLVNDDLYVEGTETATISLTDVTGATLASPSTAIVTILDNDIATATTNPMDDAATFVRQHYRDFLNREAEPDGLAYWTDQIESCGGNSTCTRTRRLDVSAAFFFSKEFQETGFFIYRVSKAAFGGQPVYLAFMRDRNLVIDGSDLQASQRAYLEQFVKQPEYEALYPASLTAAQYIDQLNGRTGNTLAQLERDTLVNGLVNGAETRVTVLGKVADNAVFRQRETNPAFVLMEYYGFLRRDADAGGYSFWLNIVNNSASFRSMVCAFTTSQEYQKRFSPVATRSDQECGP